MKLSEYVESKDVEPAEMARALLVTPQAFGRYMRGARIPRPDVMRRIVDATHGAVGPADFYDSAAAADESEDGAEGDEAA